MKECPLCGAPRTDLTLYREAIKYSCGALVSPLKPTRTSNCYETEIAALKMRLNALKEALIEAEKRAYQADELRARLEAWKNKALVQKYHSGSMNSEADQRLRDLGEI